MSARIIGMPLRARRASVAVGLALAVAATGGCTVERSPSTSSSPSTSAPSTTQETAAPMTTYASQDDALSDARTRTVELRDELAAAFTPQDEAEVARNATDGRAACTMGGAGPRRWDAGTAFLADDPQAQVEREIARLEAEGWSRTGAGGQTSVTLAREGWNLTLGWIEDGPGVSVSVGSPCYDEAGAPAS